MLAALAEHNGKWIQILSHMTYNNLFLKKNFINLIFFRTYDIIKSQWNHTSGNMELIIGFGEVLGELVYTFANTWNKINQDISCSVIVPKLISDW